MNKQIVLLSFIMIAALAVFGFSPGTGDKTIALAVKIIHDVSRKPSDLDWTNAKKGDLLFSGDQVRTGDRSIAIVKFKDKSMIRVRQNSELKIFGDNKDGAFNKTVNLLRGEFSFDIQKQEDEKFTFTTPTSVAAIRGTEGTFIEGETGDLLVVLHGLVNFLNTLSNNNVDVHDGETGVSNSDGTVFSRASTPEEKDAAQAALNAALQSGSVKEMDLEFKDKDGSKKKLRIHYRN